ncbi:MAG: XRE family transcriptional regulator [Negativicutes bacterium]|nr:XRE family transcriptional regulator [Negativicutes bacterium]
MIEREFGNNVKRARTKYNMSLQELAVRSGVSQSMLSKIERNEKTPTIRIAYQIADALRLTVSELLGEVKRVERVVVIRKCERQTFTDPSTHIRRELLSPSFPASGTEFVYTVFPPGASTGVMAPHRPGYKEYLAIAAGRIRVILSQKHCFDLDAGDTFYFEADVEHEVINIGQGEAAYYSIIDSHEAQ